MSSDDITEDYGEIIQESRGIFREKIQEYGPSFLILRPRSLVDKLWIKARRIRNIEEEGGDKKISEGRRDEYLAMINYSVIGLMQIWYSDELPKKFPETSDTDSELMIDLYDEVIGDAIDLMGKKNHDYAGAWREMHLNSITDLILDKILRLKTQTTDHTEWNINISDELVDIINYSIFYLIKLDGE